MIFDELTEVLDPEPHGAALNMAIDEVLLRHADGPLLRIYRWVRPAVSFGYFGEITEVERAWQEREVVRRWTGGGVVPHGEDITYTLVVPRQHPFFALHPGESYRAIHRAVASALASSQMEARLATGGALARSAACFESPVQHDVIVGTSKVAGGAQRRTRHGLLHQGSIQVPGDRKKLERRMSEVFGKTVTPCELTADLLREGEDLVRTKYGSEAWLRRF